jgi:predicted ATP-dependent serine protease
VLLATSYGRLLYMNKVTNLKDLKVPAHLLRRVETGIAWFDELVSSESEDRGLAPSEVLMFSGSPGCGKTTTLLQMAEEMSRLSNVLFNSLEENLPSLKMKADRLGLHANFAVEAIENTADFIQKMKDVIDQDTSKHTFVIVDSLQHLTNDSGVSPKKMAVECINELKDFCKKGYKGVYPTLIAVSQVTKAGVFAGANALAHESDAEVSIVIDKKPKSETYGLRIATVTKNRFGVTSKGALLTMTQFGLERVAETVI